MNLTLALLRLPGLRLLPALLSARPFRIESFSMEPAYLQGSLYLVNRAAYRLRPPLRGEVVVLRFPGGRSKVFLKRIVGLPEERVNLALGRVLIDGRSLAEPYAHGGDPALDLEWTLGQGQFLVLGDNRDNSLDSRRWGPVRREDLVGRVSLKCWPGRPESRRGKI
jgi:signal peptidase I